MLIFYLSENLLLNTAKFYSGNDSGHVIFIQYVTPDITAWMTRCAFATPAP